MIYDYILHHCFLSSLSKYPAKTAIHDNSGSLSFDELAHKASFVYDELLKIGVKPLDRVAFYFDHDHRQAVSILGICATGATFIPIHALLKPAQVQHILADVEVTVLLTSRDRKDGLKDIIPDCPHLKHILILDTIGDATTVFPRNIPVIENDCAAILYTSGSSGRPKGVMISHKNLVVGGRIVSQYLSLTEKDVLLGILPLSFDYGLNQLVTMIMTGGTYCFFSFRLPNEIVAALAKYDITGLAGIPPIWALLIRSSIGKTSLPRLRYITNSGGAVPTYVLQKLRELIPNTEIILMYGLTEAFRSSYLEFKDFDSHMTSIGKAIPNNELFVVREDGSMCDPLEHGELVHRGPTVSLGYWNREEENNIRFKQYNCPRGGAGQISSEMAVFSGDIAFRDNDGFLYIVGRKDNMIKSLGFRMSPSEIEEIVFSSGFIKEVAAIGISDPNAGHLIKLYLVPLEPGKNDEAQKLLIEYNAKNMPYYMIPKMYEFVDQLPKTASGKIDYPALKARNQQ